MKNMNWYNTDILRALRIMNSCFFEMIFKNIMCQQKTQYSKWRPWEFTKGLDGINIHDIEKISETSHSEH